MDSGNGIFSTPTSMHVLVLEDYYTVLVSVCRYLCNVMTFFHLVTVVTV